MEAASGGRQWLRSGPSSPAASSSWALPPPWMAYLLLALLMMTEGRNWETSFICSAVEDTCAMWQGILRPLSLHHHIMDTTPSCHTVAFWHLKVIDRGICGGSLRTDLILFGFPSAAVALAVTSIITRGRLVGSRVNEQGKGMGRGDL